MDPDELGIAPALEESKVKIATSFRGLKTAKKKSSPTRPSLDLLAELFAGLERGSGATVISSASGAELALESAEWKNGVFTHAVLEGIRSGIADTDGDGRVHLSELARYVGPRVATLTRGLQRPTARQRNRALDFALAKVEASAKSTPSPFLAPATLPALPAGVRPAERRFLEDFSRNDNANKAWAWWTGNNANVATRLAGGAFEFSHKNAQGFWTATNRPNTGLAADEDWTIRARALSRGGAPDKGYGLVFAWEDPKNFTEFLVSDYGTFAIGRMSRGDYRVVIPWTRNPHVGRQNDLAIERDRHSHHFFVNGEHVASTEFLGSGPELGFIIWGPQTVSFDDLEVWRGTTLITKPENRWQSGAPIVVGAERTP